MQASLRALRAESDVVSGFLRITGGSLARRRFKVPPAADKGKLRPTSDKVREALMSSLSSRIEGAIAIDLYAGSGALGIELLSRGAASCVFVEKDRGTAKHLEATLAELGLTSRARIVIDDVTRALAQLSAGTFDVVVADPPYALDVDVDALGALGALVAPGGVLVVERDKRSQDAQPRDPGLVVVRDKVYGDTRVIVYERGMGTPDSSHRPSAAIYPGSFDPLTNGHVDIIERGLKTFDRVVVAVANNVQKSPLFTIQERIELAKECLGHHKNVEVDTFDGLIVDYARAKGISVLLRGLRAVSDFEYEFQLASMNRKLNPDVDTVFMMTSEESFYLSSRLVREVASFGGNVKGMVPDPVLAALKSKYGTKKGK